MDANRFNNVSELKMTARAWSNKQQQQQQNVRSFYGIKLDEHAEQWAYTPEYTVRVFELCVRAKISGRMSFYLCPNARTKCHFDSQPRQIQFFSINLIIIIIFSHLIEFDRLFI